MDSPPRRRPPRQHPPRRIRPRPQRTAVKHRRTALRRYVRHQPPAKGGSLVILVDMIPLFEYCNVSKLLIFLGNGNVAGGRLYGIGG